jgi:hypothetical protein
MTLQLECQGPYVHVQHDAWVVLHGYRLHTITRLLSGLLDASLNGRATLPTVNAITDTIPRLTSDDVGFHERQDDAKLPFETLLDLILSETDAVAGEAAQTQTLQTNAAIPLLDEDVTQLYQTQQALATASHSSILRTQFQSWQRIITRYTGPCDVTTAKFEERNAATLYVNNPDNLDAVNMTHLARQQFCETEHIPADATNCATCPVRKATM